MNLHIVTDSSISATFHRNLKALGLSDNNRIVVRSNKDRLNYIKEDLPFGPLYTAAFNTAVGDTRQYEKVFIHQFSPLMYRWVATHEFKELNWMVWGTDLYNLPGVDFNFYQPLTWKNFVRKDFSRETFLFKLKVWLTNSIFKRKAYSKVSHVMTWMEKEYEFARRHLPSLKAEHQFFFYENDVPYYKLDGFLEKVPEIGKRSVPRLIIGNSGTPTNNHLDSIRKLEEQKVNADLVIPVSYGDKRYVHFLKKNIPLYSGGKIEFVERFMAFNEYVEFLMDSDGLVMNTLRPQGYGNILMMLYLEKPVFLNSRNISLSDLRKNGIAVQDLDMIGSTELLSGRFQNKEAILNFFSHDRLKKIYQELFA
jgi:dTDP-N-acetylfucosamine:lipid II N-acetylfucosaminyltransferase